jgi:hypothetical protein
MSKPGYDTDLSQSIIKTLLYYDVFTYPLKAQEIYHYLDRNSVSIHDVTNQLEKLKAEKIIFQYEDFYTVRQNPALVNRRINGNKRAAESLPFAVEKAKLISRFPFVRGVMASGSLSKDFMDENSDLDFFIVASEKRVWITRMLLVLYKKLFLRNSHKLFCINYFVDENHLEIEEKNIFTATELASIIPLCGKNSYVQLMKRNDHWLRSFFPNYSTRSTQNVIPESTSTFKRIAEGVLRLPGSDALEKMFMRITIAHWRRHYPALSKEDFDLLFESREYVSKNYPRNFQKIVIDSLNEKIAAFELKRQETEV